VEPAMLGDGPLLGELLQARYRYRSLMQRSFHF
jgi:hypothetical protein